MASARGSCDDHCSTAASLLRLTVSLSARLRAVACPMRANRCHWEVLVDSPAAELQDDLEKAEVTAMPGWVTAALCGKALRVRDAVFSSEELVALFKAVRECSYFGESKSENEFYKGTWGFHAKFRSTHRRILEDHLPFLRPVLDRLLCIDDGQGRAAGANCFFLNVFYARADGQDYHTDNIFTTFCGAFRPTDLVTVAYVNVPSCMIGGDLVVLTESEISFASTGRRPPQRGKEETALILERVTPIAGRVVDFDGRLMHAVHPFESLAGEPRVSIVLEQCRLPRRHLLRTPKCSIRCQRTNCELVLA